MSYSFKNSPNNDNIAFTIKKLRSYKGEKIGKLYRQCDLAKDINLTRRHISDFETGKKKPSFKIIYKIFKICETNIYTLLNLKLYIKSSIPKKFKRRYIFINNLTEYIFININIYNDENFDIYVWIDRYSSISKNEKPFNKSIDSNNLLDLIEKMQDKQELNVLMNIIKTLDKNSLILILKYIKMIIKYSK